MAIILPFPRPESTTSVSQPNPSAATGGGSRGPAVDSGPAWAGLMVLAQDGDRAAYHTLLNDITPYLRAIASRYLGRGEDAEDAVQEILLIVHDIRHTYERGRPFKPWLSTIATRRCIDLLRRRSRRAAHEIDADDALERMHETSPGPDEAAVQVHDSRTVHAAVDGLSPKQQEAIRLLHLEELSLSEASVRSRQSIGALKVACHRALKTLKQTLAARGQPHD